MRNASVAQGQGRREFVPEPYRPWLRLELREVIPRAHEVAAGGGVFALLVAVWCVLSYGGRVPAVFLPSPSAVLEALKELAGEGVLVQDLWVSNVRILAGFLLAAVISLPLGMAAGNLRVCEAALEPLLGFVRYLPVPAFVPLILLYAGIGEAAKVLVIFLGTAVQMVIMVADVTRRASSELLNAARTLGAGSGELFTKVIWSGSLPGIVEALRVNLGWAWTYLVVAELVAANEGLGYRILKAQRFLETDVIFLYLIIIGLLGLFFDLAFRVLHRRLFPWAEERLQG